MTINFWSLKEEMVTSILLNVSVLSMFMKVKSDSVIASLRTSSTVC